MATLAEVNSSLDALAAEVVVVQAKVDALKAGQGAATEADLDAVKAKVDAAKDALAVL